MTLHRLVATQDVPRPLEEVFAFFAHPDNLARITPPSMRLEFLTEDRAMRPGLAIEYRLRPLFGVPVTWRTRIDRYDPPHGFEDVQERGPYRSWHHRHAFTEAGGGTIVRDEVEYELPLGPLGDAAHAAVVRGELETIFRHRARVVESVFTRRGTHPAPRTVAVAGGTGFVGGAIALELHRRGERVVVLSHRGEAARGSLPDDVAIRVGDVRDPASLPGALKGVDSLVIALAFPNLPNEAPRKGHTFDEVDARGTERLVDAARRAGVGRLVYMSGAGAARDAPRHWFRAKWRAEEAVRLGSIPYTVVRPTWVYGPRDVALNRFVGFARRLRMVPLTNSGRQRLAPVFVDDVADLVADALRSDVAVDRVFELGGPETLSMRDIVRTALRVAGLRRPIVPGPTPLLKLAARPLTLLPQPPLTPDAIDFINQPATVDVAPLLAAMPRRLTPLEEALRTYLAADAGPGQVRFEAVPRARRSGATASARGAVRD